MKNERGGYQMPFGGGGGLHHKKGLRGLKELGLISPTLARGFNNSRLPVVYHHFPHSV